MSAFDLQEVEPGRRAAAAIDGITAARQQWTREHRRPRTLSAREALAALQFEAVFVWTVAGNLRSGVELTQSDFDRLTIACQWIDTITGEVLA